MDCNSPGSSSMGFPRQEYGSKLPFPPPGDLPRVPSHSAIEPMSLASPALAGRFFTTEPPEKPKLTTTGRKFKSDSTKANSLNHL